MPFSAILVVIVVAAAVALIVGVRVNLTRSREGKAFAFVALLVLPGIAVWVGYNEQMDRAESKTFCLSCHVMADYGKSLYVDDPSYLPALHFQNNYVPRDRACYTCHTDYTMFGTLNSKIRGVRHVLVEYFGTIPKPENVKLYTPFNNRECLYCHLGARKFEDGRAHSRTPDQMARIKSNQLSCTSSHCHDIVHEVATLKDATLWKETPAQQ
jgi:nitrate/TMAO reductase-like tetraheme cytochrome c subunit